MLKKLLVPLDGSDLAEQALGPAAELARIWKASIDLIRVDQRRDDDKYVEALAEELHRGARVRVTHAVQSGDAVQQICGRANDEMADLIVMTSHGRTGLSRALLGSVADGVVRRSHVPVLIVRPTKTDRPRLSARFERMLIPLDGSDLAMAVLPTACDIMARCGEGKVQLLQVVQPVPLVTNAEITELYEAVVPDEAATRRVADQARAYLAGIERTVITNTESHVVVDPQPARAIIEFARKHDVDVIAMATHGRGASRLILGSVADAVLRGTSVSVLLTRPAGTENIAVSPERGDIEEQLPALAGSGAAERARDPLRTTDAEC